MKGAGRRFGAVGGGGPVLDLNGETLTFILDRGRGQQVMGHHPPHHRQLQRPVHIPRPSAAAPGGNFARCLEESVGVERKRLARKP
jgi:hypothetical protein